MSTKPGIFDPWRQATPAPKPPPRPAPSKNTPPAEEACYTFSGKRAGLNVWLDSGEDDPGTAALENIRRLLQELRDLNDPQVLSALQAHGAAVPTDTLSVDDAALAIRKALVASTRAAALVAKRHIKAFVK